MKCYRCGVWMKIGIAIAAAEKSWLSIVPQDTWVNWKTLRLVECWKCPECGYSEGIRARRDGPVRW